MLRIFLPKKSNGFGRDRTRDLGYPRPACLLLDHRSHSTHPPYSTDFAPFDFFLFPKMKLKLKDRRFDTIEEIQAESQRVLDTLTKMTFKKHSKNGGDGVTHVYMQEGTTSRVLAADRAYGDFYDFYSVSPDYFGYHLIYIL
jgi:hypothetical protein